MLSTNGSNIRSCGLLIAVWLRREWWSSRPVISRVRRAYITAAGEYAVLGVRQDRLFGGFDTYDSTLSAEFAVCAGSAGRLGAGLRPALRTTKQMRLSNRCPPEECSARQSRASRPQRLIVCCRNRSHRGARQVWSDGPGRGCAVWAHPCAAPVRQWTIRVPDVASFADGWHPGHLGDPSKGRAVPTLKEGQRRTSKKPIKATR